MNPSPTESLLREIVGRPASKQKKPLLAVALHKTGFTKQITWQLPDKGC